MPNSTLVLSITFPSIEAQVLPETIRGWYGCQPCRHFPAAALPGSPADGKLTARVAGMVNLNRATKSGYDRHSAKRRAHGAEGT